MYKNEDIKEILNDYFYDDIYDEITEIINNSAQDILMDKFIEMVEYSSLDFMHINEVEDVRFQTVNSEIEISGKAWADVGLDGYVYFDGEDIMMESTQMEIIIEFVFYINKHEDEYSSFSITNVYI